MKSIVKKITNFFFGSTESVKSPQVFSGHADQAFGHITYAQHGEDLIVLNIIKLLGITSPTYIDIGAHHPFNISNTALLYSMGYTGVNVEANPNLIKLFNQFRPRDININCGISNHEGEMKFYYIDDWSGRNTFSYDVAKDFINKYPSFKISKTEQIPTKNINSIINAYCNGIWPDFLSIDVEGLDYDILSSADFKKTKPIIICVEVSAGNNSLDRSDDLMKLLSLNGYLPYAKTIGNIIFLEENQHKKIYSDFSKNWNKY